jgi:hypothetical protein
MTIFFIILVIILVGYIQVIQVRDGIDARQSLIQESYFNMEKLNIVLRDFTIDYEEYFNRSRVGCHKPLSEEAFSWNQTGHCSLFTNYGNGNNIVPLSSGNFLLYHCSSIM